MKDKNLDHFDIALLNALQDDGVLPQRELAQKVGLSQNACWRRLSALKERGVISGTAVVVDRSKVELDLVVFVLLRTRHHSADWLKSFRQAVLNIPQVVDFFRISGDYDYLAKIVTKDMNSYDQVYQRLISNVELDSVTSYFSMESIAEQRSYRL